MAAESAIAITSIIMAAVIAEFFLLLPLERRARIMERQASGTAV